MDPLFSFMNRLVNLGFLEPCKFTQANLSLTVDMPSCYTKKDIVQWEEYI